MIIHQKSQKPNLTPLHKCLFIQVHYYNTMSLNHGLKNHEFKPWVIYKKKGLRPNSDTPKTILGRNSAYKLRIKTAELPKLRTLNVEPQ